MPAESASRVPRGRVAGLVLAAGAGRRFGGSKAIAAVAGELFVERAIRLAVDGGCDQVLVVLGSAATDVREQADLGGADVVIAEDWADGLSASLRVGLRELAKGDAAAVVVVLVDQPWIGAESIVRLSAAWQAGAVAAVATYDGTPRNPVLLDRSVWESVMQSAVGDAGARTWLRQHPADVVAVNCDGTGSPADVDTRVDLTEGEPSLGRESPGQ